MSIEFPEPALNGPQPPGDLDVSPPEFTPPAEGWDVFMDNLNTSLETILAASPDEAVTPDAGGTA